MDKKSKKKFKTTLLGSKYETSGDNDSDYKIKKDFKDSIGYLSTGLYRGW